MSEGNRDESHDWGEMPVTYMQSDLKDWRYVTAEGKPCFHLYAIRYAFAQGLDGAEVEGKKALSTATVQGRSLTRRHQLIG